MKKIIKFILLLLIFTTSLAFAKPKESTKFLLSSTSLKQGQTLKADIYSKKKIKRATVYFNGRRFRCVKDDKYKKKGSHYFTYIGISRYQKPYSYGVKMIATFQNGRRLVRNKKVKVSNGNFSTSRINLTGKKKKLSRNYSQLHKEAKLFGQRFRTFTRRKFFKKPFILPTKGKFTTPFGAYRIYNGRPGSRHSGLDIANKVGTPVVAANKGKIIVSDLFRCNGKSVMIDHGAGVMSVYTHLERCLVKKGQWVKQGQVIGRMGKTGIATGAHVHWGMSVHNTRVDPMFWIKNSYKL
jgi:murein DD-endopeptidase MepM/ murein hydrolase activator NlpD